MSRSKNHFYCVSRIFEKIHSRVLNPPDITTTPQPPPGNTAEPENPRSGGRQKCVFLARVGLRSLHGSNQRSRARNVHLATPLTTSAAPGIFASLFFFESPLPAHLTPHPARHIAAQIQDTITLTGRRKAEARPVLGYFLSARISLHGLGGLPRPYNVDPVSPKN